MASYEIILRVPGNRIDAVLKKAKEAFGEDFQIVRKVDPSSSRADRLSDVEADVQSAATSVEELKGELEEWKENLPENLQQGGKADELDDAISQLEQIQSELESIDFTSVSFPSMF